MVQIKRVSLTEKFMICLINKCCFILYFSHKVNFHNCIKMKYNYLEVIKYYVMLLCYVRTSSLADIQALDLLLIHSQNVN